MKLFAFKIKLRAISKYFDRIISLVCFEKILPCNDTLEVTTIYLCIKIDEKFFKRLETIDRSTKRPNDFSRSDGSAESLHIATKSVAHEIIRRWRRGRKRNRGIGKSNSPSWKKSFEESLIPCVISARGQIGAIVRSGNYLYVGSKR